ncbi:MAG: hypothetical protein RL071_1515 [Pseudomonadota bacterium]
MRHLLPLLALLAACESEIDNRPAATPAPVAEAPAAPAAPPPPAAPAAAPAAPTGAPVKADPATSKFEYVAGKVTKDHPGGFATFTIDGTVDAGKLTSVKSTVDLASVSSDAPKLTEHLKSPDFFDVAKFATASFESSAVEQIAGAAAGQPNVTIKGTLDLHGVKKELSLPATVTANADGSTLLVAEFTLNRQDFGITYPGKPDDLIKDNVLLKVNATLK